MLFEFIGMLAICGVGMFFMFFGALGNSMPTVITGAIVFIVGALFVANKLITDVIEVPVETYSMTLSIDNTTLLTIPLTIVVCIATVFGTKRILK